MKRAQPGLNVFARVAIGDKRIGGQCAERADERLAIGRCLLAPELLNRPLNNDRKVVLGWLRQADAPASPPLRHFLPSRSPRSDNPISDLAQVALERSWLSKLPIRTGLDG